MRHRLTLFLLLFVIAAGSQSIKNQVGAQYPGGVTELRKIVNKNLDKSLLIREFGVNSRLTLQFSIDKYGYAQRGIFLGTDDPRLKKMSKKVVRKMSRFKPAKVYGKPSRSDMIMEIELK